MDIGTQTLFQVNRSAARFYAHMLQDLLLYPGLDFFYRFTLCATAGQFRHRGDISAVRRLFYYYSVIFMLFHRLIYIKMDRQCKDNLGAESIFS